MTRLINGPEAFTPDNEFILGESAVRGFFVAAGFCAHGIAGAGGIGQQVARWIVDGEPELDLWKMDIRRFGPQYRSQAYTLARTYENYATYYDIHYPNEERQAGRPLRLSPAYEELAALGAVFGEKSGWERPNWFAGNEDGAGVATRAELEAQRPRGWAGEHWSTAIGAEALACRRRAALFDESSFAKIEVAGPGACAFLQGLCANDIDRPVGSIVYTQLLNRRGGIESDFTVTRWGADRFLIVTGTAFGNHDLGWIRQHAPEDGSVLLRDITAARACLGLWGPLAREILAPLTRDDLSDAAFPYLTAREITIGSVPVLAPPRDLRRRAGLGAVPAQRVRADAVADDLGAGATPRPGGRRLPGHRRAAPGEGLPGVVQRHHPGGDARHGRPGLRRAAGQARRVHRPGGAAGRARGRAAATAPAVPRARRSTLDRARQ